MIEESQYHGIRNVATCSCSLYEDIDDHWCDESSYHDEEERWIALVEEVLRF